MAHVRPDLFFFSRGKYNQYTVVQPDVDVVHGCHKSPHFSGYFQTLLSSGMDCPFCDGQLNNDTLPKRSVFCIFVNGRMCGTALPGKYVRPLLRGMFANVIVKFLSESMLLLLSVTGRKESAQK